MVLLALDPMVSMLRNPNTVFYHYLFGNVFAIGLNSYDAYQAIPVMTSSRLYSQGIFSGALYGHTIVFIFCELGSKTS